MTRLARMSTLRPDLDLSGFPMLLKILRTQTKPGVENGDFDAWLRLQTTPCAYREFGICQGEIELDHVLGGYNGIKANGLLKVRSCFKHNREAETDVRMHSSALGQAIMNLVNWQTHKIKQ